MSSEMRKINCELGVLSRCDGSALLTMGDTIALAAVYGPCEVKPQKLQIDKATIDVNFKPKIGQLSTTEKLQESVLYSTCQAAILTTQHPRCLISINLQEMQDGGGLLACAINAACLALMNGGLPMKFLFAAVSCMIDQDNKFILDPDNKQLKSSKAVFTFVYDGINKNVIASQTSGTYTKDHFNQVLLACQEASSHIFQFYRDIVEKYANIITPT